MTERNFRETFSFLILLFFSRRRKKEIGDKSKGEAKEAKDIEMNFEKLREFAKGNLI